MNTLTSNMSNKNEDTFFKEDLKDKIVGTIKNISMHHVK